MRSQRLSWIQILLGVIPTVALSINWGFWWGAVMGATLTWMVPLAWWALVGIASVTTILSLVARTSET